MAGWLRWRTYSSSNSPPVETTSSYQLAAAGGCCCVLCSSKPGPLYRQSCLRSSRSFVQSRLLAITSSPDCRGVLANVSWGPAFRKKLASILVVSIAGLCPGMGTLTQNTGEDTGCCSFFESDSALQHLLSAVFVLWRKSLTSRLAVHDSM